MEKDRSGAMNLALVLAMALLLLAVTLFSRPARTHAADGGGTVITNKQLSGNQGNGIDSGRTSDL